MAVVIAASPLQLHGLKVALRLENEHIAWQATINSKPLILEK
jgi:hypothetical protein